ncbi:MAG: ATP-dependent DNA ligase [Caudoviricetes sp.]|nr:MAG: ATP-dependent DNA ligase [Caudoviricetes sp.]
MSFDKNKITELYPGAEDMMIEPMLIHNSTDAKLRQICDSGEYFGQLKMDGALYQYVKTELGDYLFGRTISKKTGLLTEKVANVPHISEALKPLPSKTILLGEIYYPGKTSKDVVSIMGCLPEKAISRQNGDYGKIHYFIYDILMYNGVNFIKAQTPNLLRYQILEKIFNIYALNKYDFLELANIYTENLYEEIGTALANGEEGMVIKKINGIYEPGKRPMTNYKAKKVDFIDAVIIGFEEPTKEYYGKELDSWDFNISKDGVKYKAKYRTLMNIGKDVIPVTKAWYYQWRNSRIKIGAYNDKEELYYIGTIHSGISDAMKKDMTENPEKYLNKVCAIQCMELDRTEYTIRHGFYKHLRLDKNPKECLIKNIFD